MEARKEWQDPVPIARSVGVQRGMEVADFGCGSGFFTLPMATMVGEEGAVYAVDTDSTMLQHLRIDIKKHGLNAKIIRIVQAGISRTVSQRVRLM